MTKEVQVDNNGCQIKQFEENIAKNVKIANKMLFKYVSRSKPRAVVGPLDDKEVKVKRE